MLLTQRPFDFFQADVLTIALVGPPEYIQHNILQKKKNMFQQKKQLWEPMETHVNSTG